VLLHGILKRAKRKGWIAANPAADAERVSVPRSGEFNVLTPEEVHAIARADGSELFGALFATAAFTGLRMGSCARSAGRMSTSANAWCTYVAASPGARSARRSPSASAACR
jgi:integrase